MINILMTEDGPDMDMVEQYVNNDPSVKGILVCRNIPIHRVMSIPMRR